MKRSSCGRHDGGAADVRGLWGQEVAERLAQAHGVGWKIPGGFCECGEQDSDASTAIGATREQSDQFQCSQSASRRSGHVRNGKLANLHASVVQKAIRKLSSLLLVQVRRVYSPRSLLPLEISQLHPLCCPDSNFCNNIEMSYGNGELLLLLRV